MPEHNLLKVVLTGCKKMAYIANNSVEVGSFRLAIMSFPETAHLTITPVTIYNTLWPVKNPYLFGSKYLNLVHESGALNGKIPPHITFSTPDWMAGLVTFCIHALNVPTPVPPKVAWILSLSNETSLPALLISKFKSYGIVHSTLKHCSSPMEYCGLVKQASLSLD